MNEKPEETGKIRDEQGRFVDGVSGNPAGRPKGSLSVTAMIKKRLEEVPPDKQKTYLEYLVDHIIKKAISDGDDKMIERIWAYVDGAPKQTVKTEFDDTVNNVNINISKNGSKPPSDNSIPE